MTPVDLADLYEELETIYSTGNHAKKTLTKVRQMLRLLGELPEEDGHPRPSSTRDLTTANMARFIKRRLGAGLARNTVRGDIAYLKTICTYAIEQGYLDRAPAWRRMRIREEPTKINVPISVEQAERLFDLLYRRSIDWEGHRLFALYAVLLMTGVRRQEALRAHIRDVKLGESKLDLVVRDARFKTVESEKWVPIPPLLGEILREWMPRSKSKWLFPGVRRKGPWTDGQAGNKALDQLQSAAREAGIEKLTMHGLRHTFGTHALVHFKIELWAVQRFMRHTDSRTTQRYLRIDSPEPLIERASVINYRIAR
ncbi:tyrosine-type recombinase/integrase [Singulisphaera sp. PoT]|uniref:tyrosine-type recombinase/integrase n=1 Tax=Singulisphaera sp. PoT TaxID=3411797 RepID=UPI003BF483F9